MEFFVVVQLVSEFDYTQETGGGGEGGRRFRDLKLAVRLRSATAPGGVRWRVTPTKREKNKSKVYLTNQSI